MAASIKPKSVVLSAGIFAIVATGAVMGARLKSEQEYKATVRGQYTEPAQTRLDRLLEDRRRLVRKRTEIVSKMAEIEGRIEGGSDNS